MATKKVSPDQIRFEMPEMHREVYYKPPDQALPDIKWSPTPLKNLPSWADAKRVSIDVETKDPDLKALGPGCRRAGNRVVGFAFAIEDGPEYYLPLSHEGGDNCPEGPENVWQYVRDQLRDFKGHILGAKLDYDTDWIQNEANILRHPLMDCQVADPMIYELHEHYSLETLCERHGLPGKDEEILRQAASAYRINPKSELWKLPARFVERYGRVDARRPLQIMRRQEKLIEDNGLGKCWTMEQAVTPLLVKVRRRGVRVDLDRIGLIEKKCRQVVADKLDQVHSITGVRINYGDVWKASVLAHALRAAGYKIPKTEVGVSEKTGRPTGGKDSVDKVFLAKCGEIGELLHSAREWNKLDTTFAKSIRAHAIERNGDHRIHCSINQMRATDEEGDGKGVRYGRTSATNPNLQQQPVRHDDFGEMWRSIFVADRDALWATSDWSQQEPRIAVDYAEQLGLDGAKEFADEYRRNPAMDIHQKFADITSIKRKICKNYVNGRIYGMGDLKTCRHIGQPVVRKLIRGEMREVPGPEGQAMLDVFEQFAPWIKGLTRKAMEAVEKRGWIKARDGRRFHFVKENGRYKESHAAFNRIGQYEASMQMKLTLIECEKEGIPIQLIVHDEFDHSFTDIKQAKRVRELQLNVVKFGVPMLVDVEIGPSWGEGVKIEKFDWFGSWFN